jgi:hypothetical protein
LIALQFALVSALNLLLFWVVTTALIIYTNIKLKTPGSIITDLMQNLALLVIVLIIYKLFSGATFKIGG